MTREYLKKNNVAYEERDVLTDLKAREEMMKKSHQFGVPVIDIDGEIIVGFDRPKLKELLGLK